MSSASLCRRIKKLERSRPKPVPTVESAAPIIIARLTAAGVKRGDNESWAEACAGAMGITVEELRRELMKRAYAV